MMGFFKIFGKKEIVDLPPPPPVPSTFGEEIKDKEKNELDNPPIPPTDQGLIPPTLTSTDSNLKEPFAVKQPKTIPEMPNVITPPTKIMKVEDISRETKEPFSTLELTQKQKDDKKITSFADIQISANENKDESSTFKPFFKTKVQEESIALKETEDKKEISKAIEEVKKQEITKQEIKGPLFVQSDNYEAITEYIGAVKNNLKEIEMITNKLIELKHSKDKEYESWRLELEDMHRKLIFIDKSLYKKG